MDRIANIHGQINRRDPLVGVDIVDTHRGRRRSAYD
jgi:hypothetical protein